MALKGVGGWEDILRGLGVCVGCFGGGGWWREGEGGGNGEREWVSYARDPAGAGEAFVSGESPDFAGDGGEGCDVAGVD